MTGKMSIYLFIWFAMYMLISISIFINKVVAREITHVAARSVHEYVWRVK